jgi:hypothetical protein
MFAFGRKRTSEGRCDPDAGGLRRRPISRPAVDRHHHTRWKADVSGHRCICRVRAQRVNAGLKRAVEAGKTLGKPRVSAAVEKRVQTQLRAGKGILKVAREIGVGTGTVQRIKEEMTDPFVGAAA